MTWIYVNSHRCQDIYILTADFNVDLPCESENLLKISKRIQKEPLDIDPSQNPVCITIQLNRTHFSETVKLPLFCAQNIPITWRTCL